METPRLLSEYLAARAQSLGIISPKAIVDLRNASPTAILKPLRCAKRDQEKEFMCAWRRNGWAIIIPL
jgi:hypothetical protein